MFVMGSLAIRNNSPLHNYRPTNTKNMIERGRTMSAGMKEREGKKKSFGLGKKGVVALAEN